MVVIKTTEKIENVIVKTYSFFLKIFPNVKRGKA